MKLDAKNDPAIREFENWVKDELHGERTEQSSTTEASETTSDDDIECQFCSFRGTFAEGAAHRRETQHLLRTVAIGELRRTGSKPPAPRAGERERCKWRVEHFTKDGADEWMVVTGIGRTVALANTSDTRQAEREMRQIVTEHNQHATLVEQRDRLAETLREARLFITKHICVSSGSERLRKAQTEWFQKMVELIDVTLTTIEQSVKNAGEEGRR